jgi:hypothetical protein
VWRWRLRRWRLRDWRQRWQWQRRLWLLHWLRLRRLLLPIRFSENCSGSTARAGNHPRGLPRSVASSADVQQPVSRAAHARARRTAAPEAAPTS